MTRTSVYALADRVAAGPPIFSEAERAVCAEALRRMADDEGLFEAAHVISRETGKPWHDDGVMKVADEVARLVRRHELTRPT